MAYDSENKAFTIVVQMPDTNNPASTEDMNVAAWVASNGTVMVKIECQTHSIQEWREHGFKIIVEHRLAVDDHDFSLSADDVAGIIAAGGDAKSLEKMRTQFHEMLDDDFKDIVKESKDKYGLVEEAHRILMIGLDMVEKIVKSPKPKAKKPKAKQR